MELTTQSSQPINDVRTSLLAPKNKIQEFVPARCANPEKDDANISWMTTVMFIILAEVIGFFVKLFR